MNQNIKTDSYLIVEIKPGLYVQYHDSSKDTFKVTDDITKARKYDIFGNEAVRCSNSIHGEIKKLKISWEVK